MAKGAANRRIGAFRFPANLELAELLRLSAEPSIRLPILSDVRGQPHDAEEVTALRRQVRRQSVLPDCCPSGTRPGASRIIRTPRSGKHWVLVALAESRYPTGDDHWRRCAPATNGATSAREHAAEFFLSHRLFKRRRSGRTIAPSFVQLHYPCYWHYDILFGLRVIDEAGHLADPRCADALDLLQSKGLPDGDFPAEHRYYRIGPRARSHGHWWIGDP